MGVPNRGGGVWPEFHLRMSRLHRSLARDVSAGSMQTVRGYSCPVVHGLEALVSPLWQSVLITLGKDEPGVRGLVLWLRCCL